MAEGLSMELVRRGVDLRRARRGGDQVSPARMEKLLKGTAQKLSRALQDELAEVPDHEWLAAALVARDSFAAVMPLAVDDVLELELRPERLERHVRAQSQAVRQTAALSEPGWELYDRILTSTCQQIMKTIAALPGFTTAVQVAAFQDLQDVRRAMAGLARSTGAGSAESARTAETVELPRRYLEHIVQTLGRLELFGLSRGRVPRTHSFDQAYVDLAVARSGARPDGEDDDELTGAGVDAVTSFGEHPRILLRGGAGAGKTTLLRRLAVHASTQALAEPGSGPPVRPVPFFVPLRQFAHRDLPSPEALPEVVARVIAAEMPTGWVGRLFAAGRAVLLVDGVDELEPARRLEAREWIEHLVTAYDEVQVIVSARPFAIPEDWLVTAGFVPYDLLPMSPKGIRDFVAAWHRAARQDHPADGEMQDWLEECERRLVELMGARLELRRLAGSPLLCGLLCALHLDGNMHLPRDRKGLFEAALDLLLVRWDETRGVQVDELPVLSKEEQLVLLQRFAYSMVKNHELVVPRVEAARRIAHAMRGLRSQEIGAEPVVQRTLERSGLLREPNPDDVQFVHRTFRDYLAAKEVVDAGDLAFVVEQAHLDHWHDVVVNTVALARPTEREWLLRRLVAGNTAAHADERILNRLRLVAAACLEHADVLDTDEARAQVQEVAARLIPPATLDDADVLARAGSFVLDLLPGPEGLSIEQAACVVRTAAMIGGEGVLETLGQFVAVGETRVIDELLRAWRRSDDPEGYARTVLAEVDFGPRILEVRGWHRVRCLRHLRHLTNVVCYGDFAPLDAVAAVPGLRRLELVQNELVRDLGPLRTCRTLRSLALTSGCEFLQDLAPLAETTVEDLSLHLVSADLTTLRSDRLHRLAIRDSRLAGGLGILPADLPLRELVLDNLPRSRNLVGVERWPSLVQVTAHGVPHPDEIEALAQLPELKQLVILDPATDAELSALREALPDVQIS